MRTGRLTLAGLALVQLAWGCNCSQGSPPPADAGTPDAGTTADAGSTADSGADAGQAPDLNPCLPFTMPPPATLFASSKRVLAHYFYPFPLSIDDRPAADDYYNTQYLTPDGESGKWLAHGGYLRARPLPIPDSGSTWQLEDMEREVRLAMSAGITGFTIDILGPGEQDAGSHLQNLLAAAAAVDTRFKIVVMPDLTALGENAGLVEPLITSVANNPSAYHLSDGRLVVSAFDASLGSVSFWTGVFNDVADAGIQVAFVPTFLGWTGYATTYAPISYGFSDWGTATPASAAGSESWPATAHANGKVFMSPVDPQQYRPKDFLFWEAGNSLAFRDAWTSAIDGGADWVQLVTWSDFSESSQIEPFTDATLADDIGTGFYDLNAYYAVWFLTGQAPAVTHDVLYYVYRREPFAAAAPAQTTPTTTAAGGGTGEDQIELVGFLVDAGTLSITVNGQTFTKDVPAGLSSFTTPLQPGTPTFSLLRGGTEVFSFPGGIEVSDAGGLDSGTLDLTYWAGSASSAGTCHLSVP